MKEQITPNQNWSDWQTLGGWGVGWISSPVVTSNADGRMELFMVGDGQLWHIWQTAPNSGWSGWENFGSPQGRIIGTPAVGSNTAVGPAGRLEVFVVTDDGAWWHRWQIAPNGGWSGWDRSFSVRPVGHGDLAVGCNADGRLEVFGCDGDLAHTWQDLGSDTLWWKGAFDDGPLGLIGLSWQLPRAAPLELASAIGVIDRCCA
jgi:hypothetical protein